jgi:uncharacterized UBP type Zn finger protein
MTEWKRIAKAVCPHGAPPGAAPESGRVSCRDCEVAVDLRICLTCGYVGCCESRNAHDTRHFVATGHPFIRPHRAGYDFLWCYACAAFLD